MTGATDPWLFGASQAVALVVGGVALTGVLVSATLKRRADRRAELWARLDSAMSQCWHGDDRARSAGRQTLRLLLASTIDPRIPRPPSHLTPFDVRHVRLVLKALYREE